MKKKWIFILAAIVIVAVVAAFFAGRGGFKSEEEKLTEALLPKVEGIGSPPQIKYVPIPGVEGKLQFVATTINKEHWERLGALSLEVKVKNISNQAVLTGFVTHTLFDKSGNAVIRNAYGYYSSLAGLKPGEVITLNLEMLVVSHVEKLGRVELSFKDVVFAPGGTTTQTPPTLEKPKEEPVGGSIYTISNYPKNPKAPGEVMAAYIFFFYEKEYSKVAELLTREFLQKVNSSGGFTEASHSQAFRGRQLKEVRLGEIEIKGEKADVRSVVLYFVDGSRESIDEIFHLKKEDGRWKITD